MANVGGMEELPDSTWTGKAGQGTALIRYQSQPGVKLGGLLQIPRAVVTIAFDNASEADRTAFLRRFELAFQRGGG